MNQLAAIAEKSGRVKLTVEDFLLLDRKGAFDAHKKVELIDGDICIVSPQLNRHARMLTDLIVELALALRTMKTDLRTIADVSARINDHSLPQPDISISAYKGDGVLPLKELALVVEVSNTTLRTDLGRKLRLYADAGVPEYWVVDIRGGKLHQMWSPQGKAYRAKREVALGDEVVAETIAGLRVSIPSL